MYNIQTHQQVTEKSYWLHLETWKSENGYEIKQKTQVTIKNPEMILGLVIIIIITWGDVQRVDGNHKGKGDVSSNVNSICRH